MMKKPSWPWIVGAAVAFGAIGAIVVLADQQHLAAEKYRRHRQEYCSALVGSADQKKACVEENTSAKDYLPWGYELVAWPDGITTWAIILTGVFIAWQAWETRKAAKASRDAIILQHRPKIVLSSITLVRQDSGEFEIKLVLRNRGGTIAHVEEWDFDIIWFKDGHPPEKYSRRIKATTFEPSQTRLYRFTAPEFYIRFEASRLILEQNPDQEQTVFLACVALIHYRDEIRTRRDTAITRTYMFRDKSFVLGDDAGESEYSD